MKNFFKKISFLILTVFAGIIAPAQTKSYKCLMQEMQLMQQQWVPDKRVAILNIEFKDTLQPSVVLLGATNLPDAKAQIIRYLTENKVTFIDSLKLFPEDGLGEKTWALTTLSVSNLRAMPEDASELVSQTMMGTPLKVLQYINKWYRVQTPENYIGWMDTAGLKQVSAKEMEYWKKSDRYLYNSISGFAYYTPSTTGKVVTDLVLGDLFEVKSTTNGFLQLQTPDGRTGYVQKADCISFNEWSTIQPNVNNILAVAGQMMGSPYLWGGASSKATDCSGFVKLVYYSCGIILARDASQQAKYGLSIDYTNFKNIESGDLIFFGSSAQRINHVGIYTGNGEFIHSSGRVYISSIDPGDRKYNVNRKIVAARSILNSLNTEGIVRVKDHPWYTLQPQFHIK